MQPDQAFGGVAQRVARKELTLFFSSPVAYLFLGAFAAVSLFVFFWGEAFFARNIADVRPLFEWMPILLIFLASTLTMRLWSEERRTGTLEHVLSRPVPLWQFVCGKFLACLALLTVALAITLPLPITVSLLGDLDWGPVAAGYTATFLLGAAYLSVGLFVSARSDNQIVSMITATFICGVLYLAGSATITNLFGNATSEILRQLGTGARFESITRGVFDLRDLVYYLSLVAVFLTLNTYTLERERWTRSKQTPRHRRWTLGALLVVLNAIALNLWLGQLNWLRWDATEGAQYSISDATRGYLEQLQEPLLIRGYFSGKTHPLLAPLVPQLTDLIKEYEIAGNGRVRAEIIDPLQNPELEQEANQKYGIQPFPFQMADRYQSSIVSSYFNVLVQYGDEYQLLGFNDLIDIKAQTETDVEVALRNPEYDLTRSVRKVLQSYQASGNLFETVRGDVAFIGYISEDENLPEPLAAFKAEIRNKLAERAAESNGRLLVQFADPEKGQGNLATRIAEDYGFKPMTTSLFSDQRFYFYMTLQKDGVVVQIPLEDRNIDSFERNLDAAIKRFASGFTKTVGFVAPAIDPRMLQFGMSGPMYNSLEGFLAADLNMQREDLSDGSVSGETDLLLIVAPDTLDPTQLFAVDQFLMQGGTVVIAASPFRASFADRSLSLTPYDSGLNEWLAHHGLAMDTKLVLDSQNAAFPVPVTRNVNGFQVQELRMLDYPFFPDMRSTELNADVPVTSDLRQATLAWASPIRVDGELNADRAIDELLRTTASAWATDSMDILPRVAPDGSSGFNPAEDRESFLLGVSASGRFDSFFKGSGSPLLQESETGEESESSTPPADRLDSVIERSPESARIVLFSSSDFLRDQVLQLLSAAQGSEYLNTLELIANSVDWSLEDSGLLSIRSRGQFNRTLPPLENDEQLFWEYTNYALAALMLGLIALFRRWRYKLRSQRLLQSIAGESTA